MKRSGQDPSTIPSVDAEDVNTEDINKENDDEDIRFDPGHIAKWWREFISLPTEVRPHFTPTAHLSGSFTLLSERAIVAMLWGESSDVASILASKVCTKPRANTMVETSCGELFHALFIGKKQSIRDDKNKAQTSYGKRTTTMKHISGCSPNHKPVALDDYLQKWFSYLRQRTQGNSTTSATPPTPPTFPPLPDHHDQYAISGMLRTDGIQLQMIAYDVRKPRQSARSRTYIQDLTRRFPSKESIDQTFHGKQRDAVVVGVDPGEVVSAAFCALNPRAPDQATNLIVKRSALNAPGFAHRAMLQELKGRPGVELDGGLHTVYDIEATLRPWNQQSGDEHRSSLQQFHHSYEALRSFYASSGVKKMNWERQKAYHAELQWAAHRALGMIPNNQPSLIVYGDGKFRTGIGLSSLHETFKGVFLRKVCNVTSIVFPCLPNGIMLTIILLCRHRVWGTSCLQRTSISRVLSVLDVLPAVRTPAYANQQAGAVFAYNLNANVGFIATLLVQTTWLWSAATGLTS